MTRSVSVRFGESGEAATASHCDTQPAATVTDGSTYSFSTFDRASSSTREVHAVSFVHSAYLEGRGPLTAPNVHVSRGDYRFVVPADEDGGTTEIWISISDVVDASAATDLLTEEKISIYDSNSFLILDLSGEESGTNRTYPLRPGEYHLVAEATTRYTDLSTEAGASSSRLRRTLSIQASVSEASLPRASLNFIDQKCSAQRCPDVMGFWVFNLWALLADNPSMRSDRGVNAKRAWDGAIDSPNDFVVSTVHPSSAYTYSLPSPESAWSRRIAVPEAAGAVFCRASAPPYAPCTSGSDCVPIHSVHHPETIVIRRVREERYYTATVASASGCARQGQKELLLSDAWPVATDADDEIQLFMPDGGHPGPFASRFILQRILEARQEAWFEPVQNMVPNGRMEEDCATTGWSANDGVLRRTRYDPLAWDGAQARGGGAVVGSACKWSNQTAAARTTASEPIPVEPGRVYFVRWFQRSLAFSKALGLRIVHDADGSGSFQGDLCGSYPGGDCATPASLLRLDHPDLPVVAPSDPDGGGPMPTAFYANDDARADGLWCGDWCWLLLRVAIPPGVRAIRLEFVAEGPMVAGIDELVMFPALRGQSDGMDMTWLLPPGEPRIVATGDSRCSSTYSDWAAQFPVALAGANRRRLQPLMTTACLNGQTTRLDLTKAVGCSDKGCGGTGETYDGQPDPAIPSTGLRPTKVHPNWVLTFLGENDAKAVSPTGGLIDSFVAGAVDVDATTRLRTDLASGATTFAVEGTAGFPPRGGRLMIGSEMVKYFTSTSTTFDSGVRGLAGTLATSHPAGQVVRNLSLQGLVRSNGARHIFVASHPWRGLTDGTDAKCSADPAARDCSEWLNLATRELIERAH